MRVNKQLSYPCCKSTLFSTVIKLNKNNFVNFIKLSELKYSGQFSKYTKKNKPSILNCKSCNHYWYKVYPSDGSLKKMYEIKKSLNQ